MSIGPHGGPVTGDDPINPKHYRELDIEPIEVIEAWGLPYHLGNVIKYIARHENKGGMEDLKKALWYLKRYVGEE